MKQLFEVHKLNEKGFKKAELIARSFSILLDNLEGVCREGREFAIAKTKLEEACFFAKKAMLSDPMNQDIKF